MSLSHPLTTTASLLALAAVGAATTAYGVMYPESQLFGSSLVAPPLPNQLALTFDDGPNPAATPRLLEVLARRKVRATFFLIGNFVRLEPALTREIAAAGHAIGNHTMSHPFLPKHSAARILSEIADANAVLEDTLGTPITLFRPPHGGRSPAVFRAARSLNLQVVQWNLIVGDWKDASVDTILSRLENGIVRNHLRRRGTNVVLHDGGQAGLGQPRLKTVEAVHLLLDRLPPDTAFVTPTGGTALWG